MGSSRLDLADSGRVDPPFVRLPPPLRSVATSRRDKLMRRGRAVAKKSKLAIGRDSLKSRWIERVDGAWSRVEGSKKDRASDSSGWFGWSRMASEVLARKGGCYQWLPIPTNTYQWLLYILRWVAVAPGDLPSPGFGKAGRARSGRAPGIPKYLKALIGFSRLD